MRVSVVIPCYRSERTIESSLRALADQTFRDFEAVVVDSSPDDSTERMVRTRFPEVRYERSRTRLSPHAARNRGATLADGELIVFTDPDCFARPDWLARLVAARERAGPIVGGGVEPAGAGWRVRGIHLCKFGPWAAHGAPGVRDTLPTANLLWSRTAWDEVGPFTLLGWSGDTELCWRARRAGYRLAFEPAAVVEHHHEPGMTRFWRERMVRGAAFAAMRARVDGWSRGRAALGLVMTPAVPLILLARGMRDAARGGRLAPAVSTLPVQLAGYLAWALGEARAHLARVRS